MSCCNLPITGDFSRFDSLSDVNIANEYFIYANVFKVLFKSDVSYMGGGFTCKLRILKSNDYFEISQVLI